MTGSVLPTYCPRCRTIRQPNGQFCHGCGYSYVRPQRDEPAEMVSPSSAPGLSIGDGFRFGMGFFVAAVIFGILFTILTSLIFGAVVGSILQALPH